LPYWLPLAADYPKTKPKKKKLKKNKIKNLKNNFRDYDNIARLLAALDC